MPRLEKRFRIESLPYWFAAVAGLVYATGFLVEFTFLSSMGIKEAASDAFKAKYIHVGLLCLFPAIAGIFLLSCIRQACEIPKDSSYKEPRIYWSSVFLALITLLDFYLLITFAPLELFKEKESLIAALFCCIIPGLALLRIVQEFLLKWYNEKKISVNVGGNDKLWTYSRNGFLLATTVLTFCIFWGMGGTLWGIFWQGGWLYIGFNGVILLIVGWLASKKVRGWQLVSGLCLPLAFTYLSVLVFAYRLYPYIPVERGGGDYSCEPNISTLSFNPQFKSFIPSGLLPDKSVADSVSTDSLIVSRAVTVLDETPTILYVTTETSQNQHENWRLLGLKEKPQTIFAIRHDTVAIIQSERDSKNEKSLK
jgi:hypothetical protein